VEPQRGGLAHASVPMPQIPAMLARYTAAVHQLFNRGDTMLLQ
jgi:hypothetical protein